jgi:hypothetical protein
VIGSPIAANRYFCGRMHRRPLFVALLDRFGWHRELYRRMGSREISVRWVKAKRPGRSIYTCRKRVDHWRFVLKPQGERRMKRIDVTNTVKRGHRPKFKYGEPVETMVPTESWELGHRYEFTRWEEYGPD